jgi:hypothetical protein
MLVKPNLSATKGNNGIVEPSQQVIVCDDIHHVRVLALYHLEVQQLTASHVGTPNLIAPDDDDRLND